MPRTTAPDAIDPTTLTLRLKHNAMTVLLFANPHTPLATLKSSLLNALSSINPDTLPPSLATLPSDPEDLVLGVPIDSHDLHKGWVKLVIPEPKSKSKAKRPSGRSALNETVHAAGLKDGNILSFRLRSEREREKARRIAEESDDTLIGDGEDGGEKEKEEEEEEEKWDVVVPKYDDEVSQT